MRVAACFFTFLLVSNLAQADSIRQVNSFEAMESECKDKILYKIKKNNLNETSFKARNVNGEWRIEPLTMGDIESGRVLYEKHTFRLEEYPSIVCRVKRSETHGHRLEIVSIP